MGDEQELANFARERAERRQRELGGADPAKHLLQADQYDPGHPVRDSHERVAMVNAVMLLTHRVGELTKVTARVAKALENRDG